MVFTPMKRLLYLLPTMALLVATLFQSCQKFDEIYGRLDALETTVSDLQSALEALQLAYRDGKIIKAVDPLTTDERGGWVITFSDGSQISLINGEDGQKGEDGFTPTVEIVYGYWWINGQNTGIRAEGVDGKDGYTPTVEIVDGQWVVNGQNTGVQALAVDGVTPYLKIDQNGYWTVSYDQGETFVELLDENGDRIQAIGHDGDKGDQGDKGAEGVSVRVAVGENGNYVLQTYLASDPDVVLEEMPTPYSASPHNVISSIEQNDESHSITLVMADGSSFEFRMDFSTPTSIALLTVAPIQLSRGTQASFEFRVNPSNAQFDFEGETPEIVLDKVGTAPKRTRRKVGSYVTPPTNYRLVRVEQVYDGAGRIKEGQYRAVVEDLKHDLVYDEMAALVLTVKNANGELVQISSSAVEIVGKAEEQAKNGLPVVIITTPGSIDVTSKEYYIEGATFALFDADNTLQHQSTMKIRGRGNSSWQTDKKPYRLKFDKKVSFWSLPKDKDWVLIANYHDKSKVHNELVSYMCEQYAHFDYLPHMDYAELVFNGRAYGTYQLGEHLKIGPGRVLDGADGYLLEVDYRADAEAAAGEAVVFRSSHMYRPFSIKDMLVNGVSDVVEGDQNYEYIRNYVCDADETLYGENWLDPDAGYKTKIDISSFVDWYLINEIAKNPDSRMNTSCFMYLGMGEGHKLCMGPVWDFDLSFASYTRPGHEALDPEGFFTKDANWIKRMFEDPEFVQLVKSRYDEYYSHMDDIMAHIDQTAQRVETSVVADNLLWGYLCSKNSDDATIKEAYHAEIERLKTWLTTRMEWLKTTYDGMGE